MTRQLVRLSRLLRLRRLYHQARRRATLETSPAPIIQLRLRAGLLERGRQ